MREFTQFSLNTRAMFDNDFNNIVEFNSLVKDTANRVYNKYNEKESNNMIREQFNKICGVSDFKSLSAMKQRQLMREHGKEVASLIEDVIADKMQSGWTSANARFMQFVEDKNIGLGDQNSFYVEDRALLTVSKFANSHHDIFSKSVRIA